MPFDAVLLRGVREELASAAIGARVDKIHQPEPGTVLLYLRSYRTAMKLLISGSPNRARIHFTETAGENPQQPPMFCMLLRKYLLGGKLLSIRQPSMERLLDLTLECTDEMGELVTRHLIFEVMGRNSNLILTGPDGRITDCLRRVDYEMSEQRQVLPGLYYHEPPRQEKCDPLEEPAQTRLAALHAVAHSVRADEWLLGRYAGLSPLICRELVSQFGGEDDIFLWPAARRDAFAAHLSAAFDAIRADAFAPTMLLRDGKPTDFTYCAIGQYGDYLAQASYPTFSALLDAFYAQRDRTERMRQKTQVVHKAVSNLHARTARKLALQRKELEKTKDRDTLRQYGDLVTANLYRITRGQTQLTTENFYDPDQRPVTIALSALLSPQQNAAHYYKEYTKAKNAEKFLTEQIAKAEQELDYLSSILEELGRAETEKDVGEIRQELITGGYLRETGGRKRMYQAPSKPMEFRSSDGFAIYVGRNNVQNDKLTLKTAGRFDLWLHTQKIHGSHVIVASGGAEVPARTVTEAAMLAAYYSQARQSANVPVDYTQVKNVKKPSGAKPGMVIYNFYNTAYVTPDAALCEALKK
ncbi:MAG: NFACT RNA binding domain-containing protein [Oscillospiraceae bacterium]|nr:NFACT RNA binding domain-containing protein [Oscillospiraceae bacterium]